MMPGQMKVGTVEFKYNAFILYLNTNNVPEALMRGMIFVSVQTNYS